MLITFVVYFLTYILMLGHMGHTCHCHRMCKGILLLVFGVLFFLGTVGLWPEFTFVKYWPLILIVAGLHSLACKGMDHQECEECKKK